jgi:DNA end-binding protein Ku
MSDKADKSRSICPSVPTVMLDLAKHIVTQKTGEFEPEKFEDHYEAALAELINAKRNGKTLGVKPRPKGENVVDLIGSIET